MSESNRTGKQFLPPIDDRQSRQRSNSLTPMPKSAPLMLTHVPWSELESTGRASPWRAMLPGPRELFRNPFPTLPGPSLTGLARPEMRMEFAQKAMKLLQYEKGKGPLNEDKRLQLFSTAVNASLRKVGVPEVSSSFEPMTSSTTGMMSHERWQLSLNRDKFSHTRQRSVSLTDQISQIGDTMYHESRHAEQHYRVARLLAAGGASIKEIREKTGLPKKVVRSAFLDPLPIPKTGRTPEMYEAEQWYHSFIGDQSKQRIETIQELHESSQILNQAHIEHITTGLNPNSTGQQRKEAKQFHQLAQDYHSIVHSEYQNLPEEKDAWEVGGDIQRRIRSNTI